MDGLRFLLRHVVSGEALGDERGPVVFSSAAVALQFAARFACEPMGFSVESLDDDEVSDAA